MLDNYRQIKETLEAIGKINQELIRKDRVEGGQAANSSGNRDRSALEATQFGDGFIVEEIVDLWEPSMRHADQVIADDQLLEIMQTALKARCKKSKTRGR